MLIRRTPPGVRGLKYAVRREDLLSPESHPARGAWIEISIIHILATSDLVAPRPGCVD